MRILGEKIRSIRRTMCMRQEEFAKRINVSQAFVSKLEQNERNPSYKIVEQIADVFGCKVEDISENGDPSPFTGLVRNCKLLTEEQITVVNDIVLQLIKKNKS